MTRWADRGRIGTFVAGALLGAAAGLLAANAALGLEARPPAPGPAVSSGLAGPEERWTSTLAQAEAAWGAHWPRAVAALETFRVDFPDHSAAKEKLYAALLAYGQDLLQSDRVREGSVVLERARILLPQRDEATSALLALTPVTVPKASPEPIAAEVPTPADELSLSLAQPVAVPTPRPAPTGARRPAAAPARAPADSPTKAPFAPPVAAAPTATKEPFDPRVQARAPTPTKVPFAATIQAQEPTPTKAPFAPPSVI